MKRAVLISLVSSIICAAQVVPRVEGEIVPSGGVDLTQLTVRLESSESRNIPEKTYPASNGGFAFRDVPTGYYVLRILDASGNEITSQLISVSPASPPLTVRLPEYRSVAPMAGTISVARLRHRPNARALRATADAQRFAESGDSLRAVASLEKAVALDPQFAEARGNLGAEYAKLGRFERAAQELQLAIELDPDTPQHQSNLAVVLGQMGRLEEAEQWARSAVARDGANPRAHLVLGGLMVARAETRAAGIRHLEIAARQIPSAHRSLAAVYLLMGQNARATEEMGRYREETGLVRDRSR